MMDWITHLLMFLIGAAVGGLLVASRAGRSSRVHPDKALRRLYKECPKFFDEVRSELGKVEFQDVREFAIVESAQITFVSEDVRLVYYEDELPNLKEIAVALEEHGFIDEVTQGKTPLYRMRDNFVTALGSL